MRGKIIVIEGTDCSGKETQSKKLIERLKSEGIKIEYLSFPRYDTPTGKIIGGPYLGKPHICEGWFDEGAINVEAKVASLYYAADRRYNVKEINDLIKEGVNIVLDRYVYSNMGHQGGKFKNKDERKDMYKWLETLEFDLLKLPVPDIKVFLYVPFDVSIELRKNREKNEQSDQHENSEEHLKNSEIAYLEISDIYNFKKIICNSANNIRNIDDINEELYNYIKKQL